MCYGQPQFNVLETLPSSAPPQGFPGANTYGSFCGSDFQIKESYPTNQIVLPPGYAYVKSEPSDCPLTFETYRGPIDLNLLQTEQSQDMPLVLLPAIRDSPHAEDRQSLTMKKPALPQRGLGNPNMLRYEAWGDVFSERPPTAQAHGARVVVDSDRYGLERNVPMPLPFTSPLTTTDEMNAVGARTCESQSDLQVKALSALPATGKTEEANLEAAAFLKHKFKGTKKAQGQAVVCPTKNNEDCVRTCNCSPVAKESGDRNPSQQDLQKIQKTERVQNVVQRETLRMCIRRLVDLEEKREERLREEASVAEEQSNELLDELRAWRIQCQRWQAEEHEARKRESLRWEMLTTSLEILTKSIASVVQLNNSRTTRTKKLSKVSTSKNACLCHNELPTSRLKSRCTISALRKAYAPLASRGSSYTSHSQAASSTSTDQSGPQLMQWVHTGQSHGKTQHKQPPNSRKTKSTRKSSVSKADVKGLMQQRSSGNGNAHK
ncbi:uncharacterized protein [Ambystoma mexicanum]|uniref:uncharacterized protein n=1 Tax=Ambystoma mexicanum TaxID=8296 RepID=UPI0037E773BB